MDYSDMAGLHYLDEKHLSLRLTASANDQVDI